MKKYILLSQIFLLIFYSSNAQQWDWIKNITYGQNFSCRGISVGSDQQGNVYVTGGGLRKFNSSGTVLWANTINVIANKSVTDTNGNTYMTGDKIAKYTSSGQQVWLKNINVSGYQDIALHPYRGVVVVGSVSIGNDTKTALAHYDENGNILWTRTGDFPAGSSTPSSITCDEYGNSYITGEGYMDSTSGNMGFLAKFDNNGNLIYSSIIPHTPNDIAIDNSNNIYVTGWFSIYPININGTIYYANNSSGQRSLYLIKYDQAGNILWHKIITGKLGNNIIATDKKGNVYLTIDYTNLNIDNINLNSTYNNSSDFFIMKADSTGNILWFENSIAGSSSANIYPKDIIVNSADEILITGAISGSHSFGSLNVSCNSSMYTDLLVAKIGQSSVTMIPSAITVGKETEISVFPNPTDRIIVINIISSKPKEEFTLKVNNSLGKTIYTETLKDISGDFSKEIDLSSYSKGIYFVELQPLSVNSRSHTREIRKIVLQ